MKKLWETSHGVAPAVEAYTVGDDAQLDERLLPYEIYGSIAHAAGLLKIGVLKDQEFKAVRDSLKNLLMRSEGFTITSDQEDIHTAVEQRLTKALGEIGAKVHTGRSRNDQIQADLRMFLKDRLLYLHGFACEAALSWIMFGRKHETVLIPGYTHLQRAMPSSLGHWAASHAEALLENCRALRFAYDEVDCSPLGSAAGYGVPLPLDRQYVAQLAGFSRVQRNTLRVQTSRPRIEAAVLSSLALVARDIGVLADDLCLFTTAEFGFLKLDPSFTTGSSIMPQKRNPDVAELTRAKAALFPGWLNQILSVAALPSGYHRDYQLTKGPLFRAVDTALQMLDMARRLPESLNVDEARCRAAVTDDMLATQKAIAMVRKGMPFRDAYRKVAETARDEAPSKTKSAVELADYPGAPGQCCWDELLREKRELSAWSTTEGSRLFKTWQKLLTLEP